MPTIYETQDGFWSGISREIGEKDGCPIGWSRTHPPVLTDADSLARAKEALRQVLADQRWQACQTFTYDGVVAPADTALMAVTGYVVAANIAPPDGAQTWKLAPGHFRQWEASDVVAYGIAIRTHIQAAFDLEGERAALIDAAEDHEELASVPITTGWPA